MLALVPTKMALTVTSQSLHCTAASSLALPGPTTARHTLGSHKEFSENISLSQKIFISFLFFLIELMSQSECCRDFMKVGSSPSVSQGDSRGKLSLPPAQPPVPPPSALSAEH